MTLKFVGRKRKKRRKRRRRRERGKKMLPPLAPVFDIQQPMYQNDGEASPIFS